MLKSKLILRIILACLTATLATVLIVSAATTIGTNISTDGTLSITGTTATSTFSTGGLAVGTNQFVVQQSSGRVGIGTAGPAYKLDVVGDANITGTYRVNGSPISATSNWTLSGNDIYYNTGNVGIGTAEPGVMLDVNGAVNVSGNITIPATSWIGPSQTAGIYFESGKIAIGDALDPGSFVTIRKNNFTGGDGLYVDTYFHQSISSNTNGFTTESYNNFEAETGVTNNNSQAGYLGGAMLSAAHRGHIGAMAGAIFNNRLRTGAGGTVGVFYGVNSLLSAWGANTAAITNNINFAAQTPSLNGGTIGDNFGLFIGSMKTTGVTRGWGISQDSVDDVNFFAGKTVFGGAEKVAAPSAMLQVINTGSGNSFLVNDEANDTTPFVVDVSGNVGIGTTTPGVKLDMIGSVALNSNILRFATAASTEWQMKVSVTPGTGGMLTSTSLQAKVFGDVSQGFEVVDHSSNALFQVGGTGNVWMKGNVGIGTTNPTALLHVSKSGDQSIKLTSADAGTRIYLGQEGAINYNELYFGHGWKIGGWPQSDFNLLHGADSRFFIDDTTGNVGIGTTTPATTLDVNGLIRVYQSATTTCALAIEGSIFYNSSNKHFWGCDGTNWNRLDN